MDRVDVFLGLGSNQGNSRMILSEVCLEMESWQDTSDHILSSFYETKAWGGVTQKKFVNAVVRFKTNISMNKIFMRTQDLELKYGRCRSDEVRWGDRLIDIDMLAYGQTVLQSSILTVPHPLFHQRLFAILPFHDIDSDWKHPVIGRTIKDFLENDFSLRERSDCRCL